MKISTSEMATRRVGVFSAFTGSLMVTYPGSPETRPVHWVEKGPSVEGVVIWAQKMAPAAVSMLPGAGDSHTSYGLRRYWKSAPPRRLCTWT